MPSSTDVVNDALSQIGSSPITNLDDPTGKANTCKRQYDFLLPAILHDHTWNFAHTRISLAEDAETPVSGFLHQYTLPGDCLRPIRVNEDDKLEWKEENGKILTDATAPITLEYTRLETDPNKWSGSFRIAFSTLLASRFAGGIAKDPKLGNEKFDLFVHQLSWAKSVDAQSGSLETAVVDDLTVDRTF